MIPNDDIEIEDHGEGIIVNEEGILELQDERNERESEPFSELRHFYKIPENATSSKLKKESRFEDRSDGSSLVIRNIEQEGQQQEEENIIKIKPFKNLSSNRRDKSNIQILFRLKQFEILCWISFLLLLNKIADDQFVQGLIFSFYSIGKLYTDPIKIFKFFTCNFTVYQLPNFRLLFPMDIPTQSTLGFIRHFISRSIRRRKISSPLLNLLFVALCRHLGLHARLILSFPQSEIKQNAKDPNDPNDCLVHPPPQEWQRQWLNLPESVQQPKRPKRHATSSTKIQPPMNKLYRWENVGASLWTELFWRKEKRWIAIDVGKELFDFAESSRMKKEARIGITNEMLMLSENTELKTNQIKEKDKKKNKSELMTQQDHLPFKIVLNEEYNWLGYEEIMVNENGNEFDEIKNDHFMPNERFGNLLLSRIDSDEENADEKDEQNEDEKDAIKARVNEEQKIFINPNEAISQFPKRRKLNNDFYVFDPLIEPPSPETSFDSEVDRIVLGDAITSAWNMKILSSSLSTMKRSAIEANQNIDEPLILRKSGVSQIKYPKSIILNEWRSPFIISINQFGLLRDVTRRYRERWSDVLSSRGTLDDCFQQTIQEWNQLLNQRILGNEFSNKKSSSLLKSTCLVDALDEFALQEVAEQEPIPTSKIKFKKHRKYVLESLLPSTEIVAPREPILGYFQGEPVFPRRNVRQLLSSVQWIEKNNRKVQANEEPLKRLTVSKRFRKRGIGTHINEMTTEVITVELYAEWQTELIPRQIIGINGKIPCTEYGNVNLIGAREPPLGCVHLSGRPGITWVVRQLSNVEWKPALIGFDFNKAGRPTPKIDGVVILEKDQKLVLDEYQKYYDRKMHFGFLKHEERTLNLWKTVFKSLLGRYYRTIDRENNRDEIEGSFIDARAAINTHTQTHLSSQQSQRQEEEPFDKHDWEELC